MPTSLAKYLTVRPRISPMVLALAAATPLAGYSHAQLTNAVSSGDFESASIWDNGVPGGQDRWFLRTFSTNPIQVVIDSPSDLPNDVPYQNFGFAQSAIGGNDGGTAELIQSAGDMFLTDELRLADQLAQVQLGTANTTGIYRISGGSLLIKGEPLLGTTNNGNLRLDSGINNVFNVIGADIDFIQVDRITMQDGGGLGDPNATLDFDITADGITPIDAAIRANFNSGNLDVDFLDFTPTLGTEYTLFNGNPNGTNFDMFDATADSLAGPDTVGLELIVNDNGTVNGSVVVRVTSVPGLLGDLDLDGDLDIADIDILGSNLGSGTTAADGDIDGDNDVDLDDLTAWLTLVGTANGDANLSQTIDTADLAILAGAFNTSVSSYGDADFNLDGTVDTADLAILAGGFGFDNTAPVAAVAVIPEPATLGLCGLALLAFRGRSKN